MGFREFRKSGAFVLALLALTLVGVPFGIEQIGETTDWYHFPASKWVKGLFVPKSAEENPNPPQKVDWESYRKDLEEFTQWVDERSVMNISLPPRPPPEHIVIPPAPKRTRQLWRVPVTSCTSGDPLNRRKSAEMRKGRVYISGFDRPFKEGDSLEAATDKCGYRIVFVGERIAWFWAFFEEEERDKIPESRISLPEFSRLDHDKLIKDRFSIRVSDISRLKESGGWLHFDSLLQPDGAVFKIRDEKGEEMATLVCIVISEKGGRR